MVRTTSTGFAGPFREIIMNTTWGSAIDAEVSYRQQRVRADFHRVPRGRFFFHRDRTGHQIEQAAGSATVTAMPLQKTGQWVAPVGRGHAA